MTLDSSKDILKLKEDYFFFKRKQRWFPFPPVDFLFLLFGFCLLVEQSLCIHLLSMI